MLVTSPILINGEKPRGTIRIILVRQRHDRSGRTTTLLDAEGLGETKTRFRKYQFSYDIEGITGDEIKRGCWLLSPREELGFILEAKSVGSWESEKDPLKRVALHVRFNDAGFIRLNESWFVFQKRPITNRILSLWEKRMTTDAAQYYRQILPTVIDSLLHSAESLIDGDQIETIRALQKMILRQAITTAESHQEILLSTTELVRATQEVLKQAKLSEA